MIRTLNPLKGTAFNIAWLAYPATTQALDDSATLVTSAGMSFDDVAPLIDFNNASGELIRHIMLEKYLELGEDVSALFDYCSELFEREPLQALLVKAYLLRMRLPFLHQNASAPILLTNQRLLQFLDALPAEGTTKQDSDTTLDVISWEFFRQILSPRLDPIDEPRAELLASLRETHTEQIERLRTKCFQLAEQVSEPSTLSMLPDQVERFIRTHVEREVAELLDLNHQALEAFFCSLFADKATWTFTLASIGSLLAGQVYITAGAAIAALSSVGASAFKAAADRHQRLKRSDYALIYAIARHA